MTIEEINDYAKSKVLINLATKLIKNDAIGYISNFEGVNKFSTVVVDKLGEYHVQVNTNNIKTAKCECHSFKKNDKCVHTIAVMIKLLEQISNEKNEIVKKKERKEDEFLRFFQITDQRPILGTLLTTFFLNEKTDVYSVNLEFSINQKKYYKIPDIGSFFHDVKQENIVIFGSRNEVNFKNVRFTSKSQNILNVLENVPKVKQYKKYNRQIKHLELEYFEILKIIENNIGQKIEVNFKNFNLVKSQLPININIVVKKEEVNITLDHEYKVIHFLKNRLLCLDENLYYLEEAQKNLYSILNPLIKKEVKELVFSLKFFEMFHQKIIPELNKLFVVTLSEEFLQIPVEKKFSADFKMTIENKELILIPTFNYGEYKYSWDGYKLNSQDKIVVKKDDQKERELNKIFENYNFEYFNTFDKIQGYLKNENIHEQIKIIEKLPIELQLFGEVYVDAKIKRRFRNLENLSSNISMKKSEQTNYFTFDFDTDDLSLEDITQIIEDSKKEIDYTVLQNGEIIMLDNSVNLEKLKIIESLVSMFPDQNQNIPIYFSIGMSEYLISIFPELNIDEEVIKFQKNFQKRTDYKNKVQVDTDLRDYQMFGINWMAFLKTNNFGGILADEMGLGKTLQVLGYLSVFKMKKRSLVIVPKALIYNWEHEIKTFTKELNYQIIDGSKECRIEAIKNSRQNDLLITSYNMIRLDLEEYKEVSFENIILDEGQYIKNPSSKISVAVKKLNGDHKFILTGTPIENNLLELWSLFDFVMPGLLNTKKKFVDCYSEKKDNNKINILKKQIEPFLLRRKKNDVLKELPEKIQTPIYIEMSKKQKELYVKHVNLYTQKITDYNEEQNNSIQILALLTKLRQIACHPQLLIDGYIGESGKIDVLLELIEENMANNKKILIFSQFTKFLKIVDKILEEKKISRYYLDGKVNAKNRLKMVNEFNNDTTPIFLISLKAGGVGLNLTSASSVIHLDPWWNPAVENQATDRAHRIGQTEVVQVSKIIAKGTIEEKIYELQKSKQQLVDDVLSLDASIISSLTSEDIIKLLSYEE